MNMRWRRWEDILLDPDLGIGPAKDSSKKKHRKWNRCMTTSMNGFSTMTGPGKDVTMWHSGASFLIRREKTVSGRAEPPVELEREKEPQ